MKKRDLQKDLDFITTCEDAGDIAEIAFSAWPEAIRRAMEAERRLASWDRVLVDYEISPDIGFTDLARMWRGQLAKAKKLEAENEQLKAQVSKLKQYVFILEMAVSEAKWQIENAYTPIPNEWKYCLDRIEKFTSEMKRGV